MLAFRDDLLKAGLEGDPAAESLLGKATGRAFKSCKACSGKLEEVSYPGPTGTFG
jgi:carbonic anhydrase